MITFKCSYISSITFKDLLMAGKNSNMTFDCFYSVFFIYYTVFTNNLIVSLFYLFAYLLLLPLNGMMKCGIFFSKSQNMIVWFTLFSNNIQQVKNVCFFFTLQWQSWMVFFGFFFLTFAFQYILLHFLFVAGQK